MKKMFFGMLLALCLQSNSVAADQIFGQIKYANTDIRYNDATRVVDLYKLLLNTDATNALVVEKAAGTDVLVVDTLVPQITIGGVLITSANIGSVASPVPAVYATDVTAVTSVTSPIVRGSTLTAGDLRLDSTSHGTPGKVYFGGGASDYYDEINATWRQKASRVGDLRFNSREQKALVTLIFDDGHASVYTTAKPIFDAQGEVGCVAPYTDIIGTTGKMTSTQLLELQSAGWEVLSHSKTHADLRALSDADLRIELGTSQSILRGLGINCDNFVYPSHYHNAAVRRVTREYYRSARGGDVQGVNRKVPYTYALASYLALGTANLVAAKAQVDAAETAGAWLIFYWHEATADVVDAVNQMIDYIQAKSIPIVTVNGALDLIGNVVDVGDQLAIGESGIRTPALDVIDVVRIWPSSYPETYSVNVEYDGGNLILNPLSIAKDVCIGPAASFRPETGEIVGLGTLETRWSSVWANHGRFLNSQLCGKEAWWGSRFTKFFAGTEDPGVSGATGYVDFGNITFGGWIEVTLTDTYANNNATGKLSRVFGFLRTAGSATLYNLESRTNECVGAIKDVFHIGELEATASTIKIPIKWRTGTANTCTVSVRAMAPTYAEAIALLSGAKLVEPAGSAAAADGQFPYFSGNFGVGGQATVGTSATKTLAFSSGTAPSTSPADAAQLYSADQTAGSNACLHTRTELGQVIKLYQQAHIADPAGGVTTDAEARAAINAILDILQNNGLMAP